MARGIKDKVAILGMGCSKFGERWDSGAEELMLEAYKEANEERLQQIEHMNQLMREGRHDQVARILRGAGHPHSATLARHIETGSPVVLASHSPGR